LVVLGKNSGRGTCLADEALKINNPIFAGFGNVLLHRVSIFFFAMFEAVRWRLSVITDYITRNYGNLAGKEYLRWLPQRLF
jgi:hypothetical protein